MRIYIQTCRYVSFAFYSLTNRSIYSFYCFVHLILSLSSVTRQTVEDPAPIAIGGYRGVRRLPTNSLRGILFHL